MKYVHISFLNVQLVVTLKRRHQKQDVLVSSKCYCVLSTVDTHEFSYLLTTGICMEARHSELTRGKWEPGPLASLPSPAQLHFIKYPADIEHERGTRRSTMWYKLIIIYIPNQRLEFHMHGSLRWPAQALKLFFFLQIGICWSNQMLILYLKWYVSSSCKWLGPLRN